MSVTGDAPGGETVTTHHYTTGISGGATGEVVTRSSLVKANLIDLDALERRFQVIPGNEPFPGSVMHVLYSSTTLVLS